MKVQMFVVRDAKAQTFGNPFFFPTVGVALRSLAGEVNSASKDSMLALHPEDFELFHVGEFDPQSCIFEVYPAPKPIVLASGLLKSNGG